MKNRKTRFVQYLPIATLFVSTTALAQIATIDISNPTNAIVTYDANPYIYAPDLPENPTEIHLDALTIPSSSDVTSQNTLALEYAALVDAGSFEGFVALEF